MQPFLAAVLLSLAYNVAASPELESFSLHAHSGLVGRQVCTVSQITPESCEKCFGAGSVNCLSNTCYNPGKGDSCCSDGSYCKIGNYCTNAGCCPNGNTLAQCNARVSLSVIPPPVSGATNSASPAVSAISASSKVSASLTTAAANMTSSAIKPTSASASIAIFTGAANSNAVAGGNGLVFAAMMLFGNVF